MANLKDLIVNGSARILGTLYANVTGNATTATTASKIKVTDHSANNATYYPLWVTRAGTSVDAYNTTSKLKFNPSTGVLTSTSFAENVTGGTGSFTSNAFGTALSVTRTDNTSGAMAIKFINGTTNKGYLGLNSGGIPSYWNSSSTEQYLVRQGTAATAVGSSTQPCYITDTGIATACGSSLAVSVTGSSGSCTGNATTATTATTANKIKVTASTGNSTYYPIWVTGTGNSQDVYATTDKLKFNASTGELTSTKFTGTTATQALTTNTAALATTAFVNRSQLYQYRKANYGTSGTIDLLLDNYYVIHTISPADSTNITVTFNTTNISQDTTNGPYHYTFEVLIDQLGSTPGSVSWPSNVYFDSGAPDLSSNGVHWLVFRRFAISNNWWGSYQGKWPHASA